MVHWCRLGFSSFVWDCNPNLDYDRNATWCEIKISPVDLAVRVHADRIRVISSKGITPQGLVAEYYEIQRQFIYEADWDVPDSSGE